MKKSLLFIFTILTFKTFGQGYHPFLNKSEWCTLVQGFFSTDSVWYHSLNDTVVDTKTYTQVKNKFGSFDLIREDKNTRKIYCNFQGTEFTMYDFSLQVGDTFKFPNFGSLSPKYLLSKIDSQLTSAGYLKRFIFSRPNGSSQPTLTVLEGIGGLRNPICPYSPYSDPISETICVTQRNKKIFEKICPTNPNPQLTINYSGSPVFFCKGDSLELKAGTGFNKYLWSDGNTSNSIFVYQSGTYYVSAFRNGIQYFDTVNVMGYDAPVTPVVTQAPYNNYILLNSDNPTGNQWYVDNVLIPGATSQTYLAQYNGQYKVVVTTGLGCSASSDPVYIMVTGVKDIEQIKSSFQMMPNPATEYIDIKFSDGTSQDRINLEVYDLEGKSIFKTELKGSSYRLSTTNFENGVYLLALKLNEIQAVSKKLVIIGKN